MGGGGGYGFSPSDKTKLEEKAKERLKQASDSIKRNVFISFSHDDLNEVNLLRGQAKNENSELNYADHSVKEPFNSENADYIKRNIRDKIEKASVTMVYLSDKSMKSEWVRWEIEQSKKMGNGVIAVYKGDVPPSNIPSHVKDNVSAIVPWKHDAMTAAINKAAKER
ncbi:MAG: TIR domain-containing protein [Gammaproteobacteria bacterium]|nr:TIR domain-containing protein [Gammaproteobacteria bacterium]MCW8922571.1 TIR domain-containing protein [Gammaproteobacteria bacterium]